jgi:hypothetical protein
MHGGAAMHGGATTGHMGGGAAHDTTGTRDGLCLATVVAGLYAPWDGLYSPASVTGLYAPCDGL